MLSFLIILLIILIGICALTAANMLTKIHDELVYLRVKILRQESDDRYRELVLLDIKHKLNSKQESGEK